MQKKIFVVLLVVAAGAAWYFLRAAPPPPPPPPPPPVAQPPPPAVPDVPLPPAADSDARVRKAILPLTSWPVLEKWLAGGDLLNRWAVVADNLAEDVSPRKELAAAAPSKGFAVLETRGTTRLDPKSPLLLGDISIDEDEGLAKGKTYTVNLVDSGDHVVSTTKLTMK